MNNKTKQSRVPKLRFPEFEEVGEWEIKRLNEIAEPITEKAGTGRYKLMSITAGLGLVSQMKKFGREIAGESYKNYYVIREGDFAYNKSSTKQDPEGQVALLENEEQGAVPNSIFTCFRVNKSYVSPYFLKYPFVNNIHGRWLKRFISVGARANGALNVETKDLFALPIPIPSLPEQQKIADCLSSLDDLIAVQSQKIKALETHKEALMQQLFPAESETVPKLRFSEFEEVGEWKNVRLGKLIKINSGRGFKASEYSKNGTRLLQIENVGYGKVKWNENTIYLPPNYSLEYEKLVLREGDLILALNRPVTNNQLKIARLAQRDAPSILYQRVGKIELISDSIISEYIFQLCQWFVRDFVVKKSVGSDQPFVSLNELYAQELVVPSLPEQQRIADCLSSLDDLITAQSQKLDALKLHKKGLMQNLFPNPNDIDE
ncbi:MAG: restriction endonuclease subunit S [Cytophagales bacterium]|nr:MAG: restriction endonuclease subunit S [Cytophagales bacterium]